MRKICFMTLMSVLILSGCGKDKQAQSSEIISEMETAVISTDVETETEVEEAVTTEINTSETETDEVNSSLSDENDTEILVSPAKEVFDKYKDDLGRLSFYYMDDEMDGEIEITDDYILLTNAAIYEKYYLDAAYVDSLSVGDTIEILDCKYQINQMEPDECGYWVVLYSDEVFDDESDKYVYEDIYLLELTEDKKHYIVMFCSDDIIARQIYEGPVYIAKDAAINAYFTDDVRDGTVEEYLKSEYTYISAIQFAYDEKTGFVTWIQNQIAG